MAHKANKDNKRNEDIVSSEIQYSQQVTWKQTHPFLYLFNKTAKRWKNKDMKDNKRKKSAVTI